MIGWLVRLVAVPATLKQTASGLDGASGLDRQDKGDAHLLYIMEIYTEGQIIIKRHNKRGNDSQLKVVG